MGELVALLVVGAVFILAVAAIAYSGVLRGGRRLTWRSVGIWVALPSATTAGILSLSDNASISTLLGVAGVLLAFIFGFAGNRLTTEQVARKIHVGLVIASKSAFLQEIRKTLYDSLRVLGCQIRDDGADPNFGRENLIGFAGIMSQATADKMDYLVVWPPGQTAADSGEVREAVEDIYRRGGLCIFLETAPLAPELAGKFALIRHDAERAAKLVVEATRRLGGPDSKTLVVLGPSFSAPALRRRAILENALPSSERCVHVTLDTWLPEEAVMQIRASVVGGARPNVVVCPNDSVGLALIDEMYQRRDLASLKRARIIGCDGLLRAYASIAEPTSPFAVTVAIPPGEFGTCAAKMIGEMAHVSLAPSRKRDQYAVEKVMDMDDRNVIDGPRARRRLYEADS